MSIESGFDDLQSSANATAEAVKAARKRRDVFRTVLTGAEDVVEVVPSGSVSRGTHKDPIHDVDLLVIFDHEQHPEWGLDGPSAEDALEYTRDLVKGRFEVCETGGEKIRLAKLNNHSVKCFLDDPDDAEAFTVDLTPAYRSGTGTVVWIPEKDEEHWVQSNPEYLNRLVAARHAEWDQFAKLVRVLKLWNDTHGAVMKSLVIEVVAIQHLPVSDRPQALSRFFAAAQTAVLSPVCDPAQLCGEIQPDMDKQDAHERLSEAADLAWRAVDAAARGETATAMCLWRQVFGDAYPEPFGGCSGSGASVVGAAAAGTATTWARPKRPIKDAPQG